MKGEDKIYVITLLFTFILGIGAFAILYSDILFKNGSREDVKHLSEFLGLPDEYIDKILSSDRFIGSMNLVSTIDEEGLKGFIVENHGSLPLSGFGIEVDGIGQEFYAAPDMLLPGSRSALVVDNFLWDRIVRSGRVRITTSQGVELIATGA